MPVGEPNTAVRALVSRTSAHSGTPIVATRTHLALQVREIATARALQNRPT
jgi:hypothetical protein